MMKRLAFSLAIAAACWAQPALAPPQMGFIQDGANSLRPVLGVAGNFVLGDAAASGVISAAFSGTFGLLKTDSTLIAIDRQGLAIATVDAPGGPALFAFAADGAPALVYLAASNTLLRWDAGTFVPVAFDTASLSADRVVAIARPDASRAALIVRRNDTLWDVRVDVDSGQIASQAALNDIAGPVLMLSNGGLVFADSNGIVVRAVDGAGKHINARLPANFAFQQMGGEWIQIRDLDSPYSLALRITPGREQIFFLPEAAAALEVNP